MTSPVVVALSGGIEMLATLFREILIVQATLSAESRSHVFPPQERKTELIKWFSAAAFSSICFLHSRQTHGDDEL